MPEMYLHLVMMAFKEPVTAALRERIGQCFDAIRRECEGIVRFELVDNQSRTSAHYSHALLSVFTSERMLDAYRASTAHEAMMAALEPHIAQIAVLDSPAAP
jgi:quinol monooxygenase YgiN